MITLSDVALPVSNAAQPIPAKKISNHFLNVLQGTSSAKPGPQAAISDTHLLSDAEVLKSKGSAKKSDSQAGDDKTADDAQPSDAVKSRRIKESDNAVMPVALVSLAVAPAMQAVPQIVAADHSEVAEVQQLAGATTTPPNVTATSSQKGTSVSAASASVTGIAQILASPLLPVAETASSASSSEDRPINPAEMASVQLVSGPAATKNPHEVSPIDPGKGSAGAQQSATQLFPQVGVNQGVVEFASSQAVAGRQQAPDSSDKKLTALKNSADVAQISGIIASQSKEISPQPIQGSKQYDSRNRIASADPKSQSSSIRSPIASVSDLTSEDSDPTARSDSDLESSSTGHDHTESPVKSLSPPSTSESGMQLAMLETHLAVPVDRQLAPSIGREIVSTAQSMSALERALQIHSSQSDPSSVMRVLQIHLSPPDLGGVSVRMTLQGSALDLQLTADQTRTRNLIERDRQIISDNLNSAGYSVNSMTIDQPSASSGSGLSGNNQSTSSQSHTQDHQSGAQAGQASTYSQSNGQQDQWKRGNDQDAEVSVAAPAASVGGQGLFV